MAVNSTDVKLNSGIREDYLSSKGEMFLFSSELLMYVRVLNNVSVVCVCVCV